VGEQPGTAAGGVRAIDSELPDFAGFLADGVKYGF
jgi:hypothetical protein